MKHLVISTLVIAFFSFSGKQSQVNESVIKETTIKTVTVKGTQIETTVETEVEEKRSVINVEGTEQTNQISEEVIIIDEKIYSVDVIDKGTNIENKKELDKLKNKETKRIDGLQRGLPVSTENQIKLNQTQNLKKRMTENNC